MKNSSCVCNNCQKATIHNFMAEDQNVETQPASQRAETKTSMQTFVSVFNNLAKQTAIFVFGILIGMGIVLKDPPVNKDLQNINNSLKAEKELLSKEKAEINKNLLDLQKTFDNHKKNIASVEKQVVVEKFEIRESFYLK